jgi:hypothetical protein
MDLTLLLDDVVHWTLTSNGWQRVDDALRLLDGALERGDEQQIRQGKTALVLAGPRRAGRGLHDMLDQPSRYPASAQTRDLANRLLHRLGRSAPSTPDPAAPRNDDDETA